MSSNDPTDDTSPSSSRHRHGDEPSGTTQILTESAIIDTNEIEPPPPPPAMRRMPPPPPPRAPGRAPNSGPNSGESSGQGPASGSDRLEAPRFKDGPSKLGKSKNPFTETLKGTPKPPTSGALLVTDEGGVPPALGRGDGKPRSTPGLERPTFSLGDIAPPKPPTPSPLLSRPRVAPADDLGLERDLELDPALADFIAQYDGELAAIGPGESEQAARLHMAIGRMLELAAAPEAAERRYQAARARWPRSITALRELRRLARKGNRGGEILELLAAEADLASTQARRAALLDEQARLVRRLQSPDAALPILESVRQLAPGNPSVAESLRAIHTDAGRWEAVVSALLELAEVTSDDKLEMGYRLLTAEILEHRLGRADEAADRYVKGLRLVPSNRAALAAAERLLAGRDRFHELYELMVRQGQATRDPAQVYALYVRAGVIALERLGDTESAIRCFESAHNLRPDDTLPLRLLVQCFEGREAAWQRLDETLNRLIELSSDPNEIAALTVQRVDNLLAHIHPPDSALDLLLQLYRKVPRNRQVLDRLIPLLVEHERVNEFVEITWNQADRTEPGPIQRQRFTAVGEYCELRANRPVEARTCYERALAVDLAEGDRADGAFDAAVAGLERIFLSSGDHQALVAMYERVIPVVAAPARKASLWWQIASLYESRLNNRRGALDALEKYRGLRPDELAGVWMQQRLYAAEGQWTQLIDTLREEVRLTNNARSQAELLYRIGQTHHHQLDESTAAIATCTEALAAWPEHGPAHLLRVRLLREERRWTELAAAVEAYLSVAPANEIASLHFELGTIRERELGDLPGALASFHATLRTDSNYGPAHAALQRIHRNRNDHTALRKALEDELSSELPPARRAGNLVAIGALLAERFDAPLEAEQALRGALEAVPGHAIATQALERILGSLGEWDKLGRLLNELLVQEQNVETRAQIAYRFASLRHWRQNRAGDASQPLELALALAPEMPGVRLGLEMLYRELGQSTEAAELLYEQSRATEDVGLTLALLKESTDLQELDAGLDATRSLHRILQLDPLDVMAIERLEHKAEARTALADLWQRRLREPDGDEYVELRLSLAEVIGGSHPETASGLLQEAVARAPGHLPALRMAANAAVAAGQHEAACRLREQEAEVVQDPRTRVAALLAAAKIARDHLAQFPRARATLQSALDLVPDRDDIFAMLADLLRIDQLWGELAVVARQHIDAISPALRPPRLLEIALLQRDQLQDLASAVATLHELLAIEPQQGNALVLLAELQGQRQHWHEAVGAWHGALALEHGSAPDRRRWRLTLVHILLERLAAPEQAEPVLGDMLAENEHDAEALVLLSRLYRDSGRLDEAAAILERLAGVSTPAESAAVLVELAGICRTLERDADAQRHLAGAAQMIRKDVASLDPLVRWADETGEYRTIVKLLEDVVVATPANMSESMVPVRLALARILADKLDQRDAAEREARMAASTSPRNVHAQLLAARLQIERHEARKFAQAAISVDPFCAEAYQILSDGFERAGLADATYRCHQVLAVLGSEDATHVAHADDLANYVGQMQAPLGPEGLLRYLGHAKLPEWGRELLSRAGHKAQVFVLPTPQSQPCPDEHPARAEAHRVAALFGYGGFELFITPQPNVAVTYDAERPTRMLLGPLALQATPAELRYFVGRGLAPMLMGTTLLELLDDRDFLRLLQGLIGLAHNGYGEEAVVKQLSRSIPRRNRKSVIEYARSFDPRSLQLDLGDWRRAMTLTARRAGLLASRDSRAAVAGLLREQGLAPALAGPVEERLSILRGVVDAGDLLSFSVSDDYAKARRQLGLSADPAGRDGA